MPAEAASPVYSLLERIDKGASLEEAGQSIMKAMKRCNLLLNYGGNTGLRGKMQQ